MLLKHAAMLLSSAAIGDTSKEIGLGGVVAISGFLVTNFLGGWDAALKLLIFLFVADYVTGVLGAFRTKLVNSETMFWGGIRKGIVLMVISIAAICDQWVGGEAPVFRTLALYFYVGREGLSLVENLGMLGLPMPNALTKFLTQLQDRSKDSV
jgi:toxin secretion/phage lysis holin